MTLAICIFRLHFHTYHCGKGAASIDCWCFSDPLTLPKKAGPSWADLDMVAGIWKFSPRKRQARNTIRVTGWIASRIKRKLGVSPQKWSILCDLCRRCLPMHGIDHTRSQLTKKPSIRPFHWTWDPNLENLQHWPKLLQTQAKKRGIKKLKPPCRCCQSSRPLFLSPTINFESTFSKLLWKDIRIRSAVKMDSIDTSLVGITLRVTQVKGFDPFGDEGLSSFESPELGFISVPVCTLFRFHCSIYHGTKVEKNAWTDAWRALPKLCSERTRNLGHTWQGVPCLRHWMQSIDFAWWYTYPFQANMSRRLRC